MQVLVLLTCSNLRVIRINLFISSVVDLSLFFLEGGTQTASEEFDKFIFLLSTKYYVLSSSVGVFFYFLF
jgi:hypothetical protein